jgi:lactoylglutathione lyase
VRSRAFPVAAEVVVDRKGQFERKTAFSVRLANGAREIGDPVERRRYRVREQLDGAPPELRGYVDGVVAFSGRTRPPCRGLCLDRAMDRVGYVILFVGDLERSVAFYRDVIGVPFRLEGDGYVEFATQGARFGLYDRNRLEELTGQGTGAPDRPGGEVVFLVEDVDAEAARLRAAGATILKGPVDRAWGHRTLHVEDPDGFVVELAEEIPRQPSGGRR